jgi:hypothetical protein
MAGLMHRLQPHNPHLWSDAGSGVCLPLTCFCSALPPQELEARINKVIEDYKEKLQLRTDHHMGWAYRLKLCSRACFVIRHASAPVGTLHPTAQFSTVAVCVCQRTLMFIDLALVVHVPNQP